MTLKQATELAIIGTIVELSWTVIYYIITFFDIIDYSSSAWFFHIWIIPAVFFYTSLLIFFITLYKKQKGSSNV